MATRQKILLATSILAQAVNQFQPKIQRARTRLHPMRRSVVALNFFRFFFDTQQSVHGSQWTIDELAPIVLAAVARFGHDGVQVKQTIKIIHLYFIGDCLLTLWFIGHQTQV